MKRFVIGLLVGFILATTVGATASSNIRLIVNGRDITTDVPPQIIDGRVMVPVRFVAEALGAKVEWDQKNNTVIIISTTEINNENSDSITESATLELESGWIALRDVAIKNSWIVSGDGFVYKNMTDQNDNKPLFNWQNIAKIVNSIIYIPRSIAEQY